jgi:predicted ATP-grasp superfamily ATP-dependent carboligase
MKVLVLDGNENQAVAAVRSLAKAGHTVFVGATTSWSKAGWSRFCHRTFRYDSPEDNALNFVQSVAAKIQELGGAFVMPMTERTTLPISLFREFILQAGGTFVLPSHEILLQTFDKAQTTALAKSLGIEVPFSIVLENLVEAQETAKNFHFPAVLKPCSSEEFNEQGQTSTTGRPHYASNEVEFLTAYSALRQRCERVIAQEFIAGTGAGYFALMHEGELRAEFAHQRIRDVRPTGSGSAVRISTAPDPIIRAAALALLQKLHWHGVAMVEFRVRLDGTPVFLEINGRFWNSLALPVYAGADFPAWLVQLSEHQVINNFSPYKVGLPCRWLLGDVRHLIEVWRGAPASFPGKFPARVQTTISFFTPTTEMYHDNFLLSDPLPEFGDWLDFVWRRLRNRKGKQKDLLNHAQGRYSHS